MKLYLLIVVALLAGCANMPGDPAKMSAEQLKEWVRDKNANLSCGVFNSPYGRGVMTYVVLDKGIVVNGSVTLDSECKVTITNTVPAKPDAQEQAARAGAQSMNCYKSATAIICEPIK